MKVFGALLLLVAMNAAAIIYYLLEGPSAPLALVIAMLSIFIAFRAAAAAREGTARTIIMTAGTLATLLPLGIAMSRTTDIASWRLSAGL